MSRSLETLAVLAAACIVGGLVFRARGFAWAALALLLIGLLFRRPATMLAKVWLGFASVPRPCVGHLTPVRAKTEQWSGRPSQVSVFIDLAELVFELLFGAP